MEKSQYWGEIICDRVPWSRSISRFVDKQIRQWVDAHEMAAPANEAAAGGAAHYQVVFERQQLHEQDVPYKTQQTHP